MKTKYLFAALLVVLGLVATGCQKETPSTPVDTTVHTIAYTVDGEEHQQTLQGQEALENFVTWVMQLTRQGHTVVATDLEAATSQHASKETVVFVTTDEREAAAWEVSMLLQGYTVTTVYDSTTGEYHCSATITTHHVGLYLTNTTWQAIDSNHHYPHYYDKSEHIICFTTDSTGTYTFRQVIIAGYPAEEIIDPDHLENTCDIKYTIDGTTVRVSYGDVDYTYENEYVYNVVERTLTRQRTSPLPPLVFHKMKN